MARNRFLNWPIKLRLEEEGGKANSDFEQDDFASRVEQKSNAVKEKSDSKEETPHPESNSKIPCKNCGEIALHSFVDTYDYDGEPELSLMDCLNCGFKYSHFNSLDKSKSNLNQSEWITAFMLVIALLITVIVVKDSQKSQFATEPSPSTGEESIRSSDRVPIVLNEVEEPFGASTSD